MSKRKISWNKESFLKIVEVFLIAIMIATTAYPKEISAAEQNVQKYKYFIVKKNWTSDIALQRPTSITIHIESIDGSYSQDAELLASENWEKEFSLPAYKENGSEIVYTVYEKEDEALSKYNLSNPSTNKIVISEANENCIIIEDNSSRNVVTAPYDLIKNTNSFLYDAPYGNIRIDTNLLLENATRVLSTGFSYSTTTPKYGNPWDGSDVGQAVPRILYTGNLNPGNNQINGSIVLTWADKAVNFITGETYDVQITVDNISIFSVTAATNKTVSIMSNVNGLLEMESFVTTFGTLYENVIGVGADIQIKLIGAPSHSYAQMYVTDLDVGDYASGYNYGYTHDLPSGKTPEDYVSHSINDPYVEAVELKSGIASSVYVTGDTRLVTNTNNTRYVDATGSTDVNNVKNSLKFLAEVGDVTNCYKYRWTGSKCETAIITLSTVPDRDSYTNPITNSSSLYRVQYFFQKNGAYSDTPDIPKTEADIPATLVMVKPGTEICVNNNAEKDPVKVDETKTNYVLDSDMTDLTTTQTTSSSETKILNVYFKEAYTVIYHDNVGDIVWDAKDQTNTPLNYGVNTPIFTGTVDAESKPVRSGYKFLGWSDTPDGDIISIPPTVTANADYWAHWEALPNKYIVHYFYEVDGSYPSQDNPDYVSEVRTDKYTDELATITESDKVPNPEKVNYFLNNGMTSEWQKIVAGDGSTILRVYFKKNPDIPKIPVTGVE